MDITRELVQEMRESYLGANQEAFIVWVKDNIGIEIDFPTTEIIDYLRELHWQAYLDDLETADNARLEVLR